MFVAVLEDDEIENEIEIDFRCETCCRFLYGWSKSQYNRINEILSNNEILKVPAGVNDTKKLISYIKLM